MVTFSGVIFDFNGTLLWDTPLHYEAWNRLFQEYSLPVLTRDDRTLLGKNTDQLITAFFGAGRSVAEKWEIVEKKEAFYREACVRSGLRLAPGAETLLDFLKEKNLAFTIGTATGKTNLDFYFEHYSLGQWFTYEKIVYDDGTLPGKPDPRIFEIALTKIGKAAAETVIFEDSFAGIHAAINAKAGRVFIVDADQTDYAEFSPWNLTKITHFDDVDRGIFAVS